MRFSETTKYLSNYLTFGRILSRLNNSRWDRYLGMTAAMTQLPVPTARHLRAPRAQRARNLRAQGNYMQELLFRLLKNIKSK